MKKILFVIIVICILLYPALLPSPTSIIEHFENFLPGEIPSLEYLPLADSIHSDFDLLSAMEEKAKLLSDEYSFIISQDLDVTELLNNYYFDYLESVKWVYNYIADADGNEIPRDFNEYDFFVTYRDDFKALAAFKDSDLKSKLSARETELLHKAEAVISDIILPDMNVFQQVLAIHDYLVLNAQYDTRVDTDSLPPSNRRAEGVLLNGMGVCSSFASSMKLLLGMIDIECLYVIGHGSKSDGSIESHAWNKVKIDGHWYNIDVTWDNPVPKKPGEAKHIYMCVTDDMLARDHIWDYDAYPRADSMAHNYYSYNGLLASDADSFKQIILKQLLTASDAPLLIARAYLTDYRQNDYELQFIYDALPDVNRVSYSFYQAFDNGHGLEGEIIISAYKAQ